MNDLKAAFEELGFANVTTYIQSGNVLFSTDKQNKQSLVSVIEQHLSKKFNYLSQIVLVSVEQLRKIVESAPELFGDEPEDYKYNVLFIKEPLTAEQALKFIPVKEGVDKVSAGDGVLYFAQLRSKMSQGYLKIIGQPIYKEMTIRNWNTTTTLLTK